MARRRGCVIVFVVLLTASCTGGAPGRSAAPRAAGGTLTVGADGAGGGFFFNLDPQYEYSFDTWEILRCCLLRMLMSYDGTSGVTGAQPQPDLAARAPDVSADGLTWTFHLRPGLHYGPPLQDVPITSSDIVRALLRAGDGHTADIGLSMGYLGNIEGFETYVRTNNPKPESISGLETPDPLTLRIHLLSPDATLPYDLALPNTAPIPPSPIDPSARYGVATGHDRSGDPSKVDGYGLFLVSSGPYTIEGEDAVDFSKPPAQQTPPSGFVPWRSDSQFQPTGYGSLTLVRNPSWDRATDPLRTALPDRIVVRGGSANALFREFQAGHLDMVFDDTPPPGLLRRYLNDPSSRRFVQTLDTGNIVVADFNLSQPPFDDVAVRRAVADALDRRALLPVIRDGYGFGGVTLANHYGGDSLEEALASGWSPFPSSTGSPDLQSAHKEMSASRYGDAGRCADPACRHVTVYLSTAVGEFAGRVRRTFAVLGIDAKVAVSDPGGFYDDCRNDIHAGLCVGDGWFPDYPSVGSQITQLFGGPSIIVSSDLTRMGESAAALAKLGAEVQSVPSVDPLIRSCDEGVGHGSIACWTRLDQYIVTQLMPSVPLAFSQAIRLTSPSIATFSWDQAVQTPALDRIGVSPAP
jgi:peptide/nickel transport system substrate-binding protein